MANDQIQRCREAAEKLRKSFRELAKTRAEYQEATGESPYGILGLDVDHPPGEGPMDRAREIVDEARKEYAGEDRSRVGYEPTLIRHIAAALEADDEECRGAHDSARKTAAELAQARTDLQDQVDENEQVRVELERAEATDEATDEEQGDAEDTITVAKDTRRLVREILAWLVEDEDEPRTCEPGEGKDRALPDDFPYAPGPRPEIPATERVLAGLPASPDWPKIAAAEDSAFLRGGGGRAPYEKPTVVPWEVRFAELVGERVTLRDRVDELLASNSLEIQKRRAAEVLAGERLELLEMARRQGEKNAATAVGLFDDQYAILSRYRVALMACRDHTAPVDEIVAGALK